MDPATTIRFGSSVYPFAGSYAEGPLFCIQIEEGVRVVMPINMFTMRPRSRIPNRNPEARIPMDRLLSKRQAQLRGASTKCENLVKNELDVLGIRYIFQKGCLCRGYSVRLIDFMLTKNKILLEIDGPDHEIEEDIKREILILGAYNTYRFLRVTNDWVVSHNENLRESLMRIIHAARLIPRVKKDWRLPVWLTAKSNYQKKEDKC